MMPAALIYALSREEERDAAKRAAARQRLVVLLTQDAAYTKRRGRRGRSRS
jgi:hypothetical protein